MYNNNKMKVVNCLKVLDKFFKFLKTDRNTFFTYILTLITVFLVVDRVTEMLIMIFTGMSVSYWGPIAYTFAIACPVFAFLFSGSSKFVTSDNIKIAFFDVYMIALYIMIVSMFTQWMNQLAWMLFLSVPNYAGIVANFSNLIGPAFTALSLYLPLTTFYPVIKWLLGKINDTKLITDSIIDYNGINLSDKSGGTGPYTCEITIAKDKDTGKTVKLIEERRFNQMLVAGISGAGKTSLIFEPMIAKDIDKKYFFKSIAKEMGFTALKSGIATLNCPYTEDYINSHFNLNMLSPVSSKLDVFNTYMKKMIISSSGGRYSYRDLGITYMNPDSESISHIKAICDSYKIPINIVDPLDSSSIGLNPFVYDDPLQTAVAVSSVIKGLYATDHPDMMIAYRENAANQAVENICLLLKEMYPRLHKDDLPNLQDVSDYLNDFSLVENMCEELKKDDELSERYTSLLKYFSKNFYKNGSGRDETEKYVTAAATELDNLLRYPGVKEILCNRLNNLNYDDALENGEVTLVCTRRGDLGPTIHKAFGLFFLLLMQYSVLKRPGSEKTRVPHFLYIDEFADYACPATDPIFNVYRKYKVATVVSIQDLSQLGAKDSKRRQTILSNCGNKIVFGNGLPEDNDWWSLELGNKKDWVFGNSYDTVKGEYDPKLSGIGYNIVTKYKPGKIQSISFKQCMYKIRTKGGSSDVGIGMLDFLSSSYTTPKKVKDYDFDKFSSGISESEENINEQSDRALLKHKTIRKSFHFKDDIPGEINPVQTDVSDSHFKFDNEDAIVINLKNNNDTNNNSNSKINNDTTSAK